MRTKQLLTKMMLLVAVMLMGTGTAWGEEVTIASFSYSSSNEGWTITNPDDKGTGGGGYYILYSGASIVTPEIAWSNYSDITITISARKYGGPTATEGKISVSQGDTELASYSPSGTSIVASSALSISPVDGTITISCPGAAEKRGCGVQSIVIKGTEKASASPLASIALSGDYPTSFFVSDAFSTEGMTVTATYEDASTKDVTSKATFSGYDMATPGEQTVTVSYTEGEVTKTATYSITVNAVPTHNVTWSVNGTTTTDSYKEGAAITFPANIADVEGKSFVGWVTEEITGTTDEAPTFVTSATMGTEALTFYAVFADKTPGTQTTVTDVLTSATTGITTTGSYKDWSGKTLTSDAVYAGNSAVSSTSAIQMRSTSNSGIFSTTSGGSLKSVTVTWSDGTVSGRTLDVYGSNTAYSEAANLYDSKKQGTKLGSIVYGTSTSLTVSGDYAYIGLRSNNGAMYFTNISIEWTTGAPDTYSAYCTTVVAAAVAKPVITVAENPFFFSTTATITCATEGATIKYSFDGETWNDYSEALTITETTTVYAKAIKGNDESTVAQVTATKNLATPTVSIDATGITNTNVYDGTAAGSLAATVTYNDAAIEGATVAWSGNNDEVATIDATGAVTLVAAGSVTFTATYAGSADYNEATATYTMTVTNSDPNAPGTENNPYTVAQAIAATPTTGEVYISGIVSSFYNTSIVGDGSNYRYYISDDGTTDTQLLVYKGKGLNQETFSDADDLKVGDEVVIYGKLTTYQNAPEVASGNYLTSWNRPADTTPSITLSTTTVEATAYETEGEIEVTYNNFTLEDADVVFYESDGTTTTTCDWIVTNINASNNLEYIIEANNGAERTAYMKVYALDGDANEIYSQLITVTQAKYVVPDVTVDPAVAGVGAFVKVTSTEDITAGNYLIVYEGNDTHDAVAFNGALETLDAASNGIKVAIVDGKIPATDATVAATFTLQPSGSLKSASGLYIGKAAYSNGLDADESALANTFAITDGSAVITAEGGCTLRYNYASDQLRFRYYKSGQQAIQLYKYDATAPAFDAITVTTAGYATYCSENNLDFSNVEGLTAYKATVTDKQVSFDEVGQVPAGDGVLLKGAAGTYAIPVIDSAAEIENALVGVTEATEKEAGIFVLMNPEGGKGVGFYKTTQTFTVGANTAYLPAIEGTRSFIALDEATAIEDVAAEKMLNGEVYNLQGQRVVKAQKGLYIMDGKKVLVK